MLKIAFDADGGFIVVAVVVYSFSKASRSAGQKNRLLELHDK